MAETTLTDISKYKRLNEVEHVLKRSDMYISSIRPVKTIIPLYESSKRISDKEITYNAGYFKIVDEVLVNAFDQVTKSYFPLKGVKIGKTDKVTTIKAWVDKENGRITILNDGKGIPIVFHEEEKVWLPHLLFGFLRTSENYDDNSEKISGGKFGFGVKLCNIFSREFRVRTYDAETKKVFTMTWYDNMSRYDEPLIESSKKNDFRGTEISFIPDYERFSMKGMDSNTEKVIHRRIVDIKTCCPPEVSVFFNEEEIKIESLTDYAKMYLPKESKSFSYEKPRWNLVTSVTAGDQFRQVSFVNGINTYMGGTHVDHVVNQIVSHVQTQLGKVTELKDKSGKTGIRPADIRRYIFVCLQTTIVNPDFNSQSKEKLETPYDKMGSTFEIPAKVLKEMDEAIGLTEAIKAELLSKAVAVFDKPKKAKKKITDILKLEDADKAGSADSRQCTLFITEGDSAKSMVISGFNVIGRDYYGVFPLKGKLKNVRSESLKDVGKNEEIKNIVRILGLENGKTYTEENLGDLRYGSLCILTDQDHDGSHIKGLVINFLHVFFPSLLRIKGFLKFMITPISKATKSKEVKVFYTYEDMEKFQSSAESKTWKMKYYKGLGTSTPKEAQEYFAEMDKHLINFLEETPMDTTKYLELAFKKELADDRKVWVNRAVDPVNVEKLEFNASTGMTYNDFINKELVLFSIADNIRSIPSVVDGLKPSQRKVLYGAMTRPHRNEDIKVSQMSGYISEKMAYHHGEASLNGTIVNMAQDFVGSNNINQLVPSGQFGSRTMNGNDSASPRYIFTHIAPLTDKLYIPEDMPLLTYNEDDGLIVEPIQFMPILPMILVNGSAGIGTGYSCDIPCYNPEEIVENLYLMMENKNPKSILPWYRNFRGTITKEGQKYTSHGIVERTGGKSLYISELPIGVATQSYKEKLYEWLNEKDSPLKDIKEDFTDTVIGFGLEFNSEAFVDTLIAKDSFLKDIGLQSAIKFNLHMFSAEGNIKKYNNPTEVLVEFYAVRRNMYERSKNYLELKYDRQMRILSNKLRYLKEVIDGKLVVFNKNKDFRIKQLKDAKYDVFDNDANLVNENPDKNGDYTYLTSMSIDSFGQETQDRLKKELEKYTELFNIMVKSTAEQLWKADLADFMTEYKAWKKADEEEYREAMETALAKRNGKEKTKKSVKKVSKKTA